MNNLVNIIQKTKNIIEVKEYIEKYSIIIKNLNNKNFDIILYLIEFCSSYEITRYFIKECRYDTFNYTCYGLAFRSNQVPLFTAIIKKKFKVADLLIENGASINYCIDNFDGRQISILDYICFIKEVFDFDIEQLKYILNNGYNKKIPLSIIIKLIKNKKVDLLKFIFQYDNSNSKYILKWLMFYKNKISLSHSNIQKEINRESIISSDNEEDNKLEINKSIFDKLNFNFYQDILCLMLEYHCVRSISPYKMNEFLESAVYSKNLSLLKQILKSPFFDIKSVSVDKILYKSIRIFDVRPVIECFIHELKSHGVRNFLQKNSYEKILKEISKIYLLDHNNRNMKSNSLYCKDNLKLFTDILLYNNIPCSNEKSNIDMTYIKGEDESYLSLIINLLIKVGDFSSLQKLMEDPLIKPKININLADNNNEQPIITAFDADSIKIFNYLLEHGANPNVILNNCETRFNDLLLYSTIIEQKFQMTACLLVNYSKILFDEEEKKEIRSNNQYARSIILSNYKTYSPDLIKAIYLKKSHEVELLLEKPENKNVKGLWEGPIFPEKLNVSMNPSYIKLKRKFTALVYSYLINDNDIFNILIECSDINEKDGFGNCLLFYAILKEDLNMITKLMNLGAEFENVSTIKSLSHVDYYMAIEVAIYSGNKNVFLKLIEIPSINLNRTNYLNNGILEIVMKSQLFSETDKYEMIENLLKRGCRRDLHNSGYNSPMFLAVNMNSLTIVKLFIKYGAKIDFGDDHQSLLEVAIYNKSLPMIQLLLDNGTNVNAKVYNERYSLLWYALKQGDLTIVQYLMKQNVNLSIGDDITYEDLETINQYEDVATSKEFQSILQYNMYRVTGHLLQQIIHHHNIKVLKLLLNNHLEIDKKDSKDNTLLANAIIKSDLNMVNFLINQGADLHSLNQRAQSIYDLAITYCNTYHGRFIYNKIHRLIGHIPQ